MRLGLRSTIVAGVVFCAAAGAAQGRVTFSLDYSYDPAEGVFDGTTAAGLQARATMQRAAQVLSDRLVDNLTAIAPGGGNTWSPRVVNPATGAEVTPALSSAQANVIRV